MGLFNSNNAMKAFTEMKESLHKAVYESVGKQLMEESKLQQQKINEQLAEKIQQFTENLSNTAKEIIGKEFESRIKQIIQEEIRMH